MYGLCTYIRVIFRVNVGKYSSTMEHMGLLANHIASFDPKILEPYLTLGQVIVAFIGAFLLGCPNCSLKGSLDDVLEKGGVSCR